MVAIAQKAVDLPKTDSVAFGSSSGVKLTKKEKEKREWEKLLTEELTLNEVRVGRYTIVTLTDKEGRKGHGLSRCSEVETYDAVRGTNIATGRARLALLYKRLGKELRNHSWYIG